MVFPALMFCREEGYITSLFSVENKMSEVHMSFCENLIIFRDGHTFVYTNKIDPLLQHYKDSMA
jgi:hypothetical protein